jgi:hypothetical protein
MFKSQKNVFWEALLVTVLIFGIGVFMGVVLENWRTSKIGDLYQQSDVELLDIKTQNEIYSLGDFNCEIAIEENLRFADRIYEEARLLDRYEKARRITDTLKLQHRKYDVLRALLWVNSMKIKKRCKADYINVVYIYDYNDPDLDTKAKQSVFSKILSELKENKGSEIILIPLAGDNDLSSVNILMDLYDVAEEELPVILIDEKTKITEVESVEDIEKLF